MNRHFGTRWDYFHNQRICYRCGICCFPEHFLQCRARTSYCYSCGLLGHYSRCCRNAQPQSTWKPPRIRSYGHKLKRQKRKSQKQKERDRIRYSKFINQKRCVVELAFSSVCDDAFVGVLDVVPLNPVHKLEEKLRSANKHIMGLHNEIGKCISTGFRNQNTIRELRDSLSVFKEKSEKQATRIAELERKTNLEENKPNGQFKAKKFEFRNNVHDPRTTSSRGRRNNTNWNSPRTQNRILPTSFPFQQLHRN